MDVNIFPNILSDYDIGSKGGRARKRGTKISLITKKKPGKHSKIRPPRQNKSIVVSATAITASMLFHAGGHYGIVMSGGGKRQRIFFKQTHAPLVYHSSVQIPDLTKRKQYRLTGPYGVAPDKCTHGIL